MTGGPDGRPVGVYLDAEGARIGAADDELYDGAVVIVRTRTATGGTALRIAWTDGLDWIARYGMLAAAAAIADREEVWGGAEDGDTTVYTDTDPDDSEDG